MVTGVIDYSTNQSTKKAKQRPQNEQSKERPTSSRLLFAPHPQTFQPSNKLPMPKTLKASLPVFDGKSE